MRSGILPFGQAGEAEGLAQPLRERDVDVVIAGEAVLTGSQAAREAAQLQRADCDGVLLLVSAGAAPAQVGQAALHLGVPVALCGSWTPEYFDAGAVLREIGVPFDRFILTGDVAERIFVWLEENKKTKRQPGIEAVHKLYGRTLALGGDGMLDPILWKRQFGVTVIRGGVEADADFYAADGDALSALTAHLLRLISNGEPYLVSVTEPLPDDATFAQIVRIRERFVCLCLRSGTPQRIVEPRLLSSRLWAIPGQWSAALRALCEALDIDFTVTSTE